MNALAFIVGNVQYQDPNNRLLNAVNDANDIADKLMSLGFTIIKRTDCNIDTFDRTLHEFSDKLENYDVGLFYFSGHGLQIDGINYLTMTNTSFADSISAKHTSITLDEVIERMQKKNVLIKILILDACRNNPLPERGINPGLAPVRAPKGTIIAFSTSPGETALDYGSGHNSIYTGALLNHIADEKIPIEDFFKRVRTTVYTLSRGRQTSWEHTSLIGNFCFNSGQLVHSLDLPYREECIADSKFVSNGSEINQIIEELRSHNWYVQSDAIKKLSKIRTDTIDASDQFLIGRNMLSTALGNEFSALDFFNKLSSKLRRWTNKFGYCHFLNGVLFEIYFDSNGKFRKDKFKSELIDKIFELENNKQFEKSFRFIQKQLEPFRDYLCYIPAPNSTSVPIDLVAQDVEHTGFGGVTFKRLELQSVSINGKNLMQIENPDADLRAVSYGELIEELEKDLVIPSFKFTDSINLEKEDIDKIYVPFGCFVKMN